MARVLTGGDTRSCATVRETARLLGVHENTVRNMVDDGRLAAERLPFSGYRRVPLTEIERLMAQRGDLRPLT